VYHAFFEFNVLPFENTPDPRFFYASEQHREALAAIEYTIRMRKGFVLITGDIGSGKTTVGRTMCQRAGDAVPIVQVGWGHASREGLVRQILRHLHIRFDPGDDHGQLLDRLREHLDGRFRAGQPVVLFVDEAQTLSDDALDELRLLSNFDTATDKLVQIVLVGQPELRQRIRESRHAALRQRIVLAKQLRPLNLPDTHQYIQHRIRAASRDPRKPGVAFDPDAMHEIFNTSGGVPRLINVMCDNCLLLSYVRENRRVGADVVRHVAQDMVPNLDGDDAMSAAQMPMRLAGNI
jgi:general secretion pathway protein A